MWSILCQMQQGAKSELPGLVDQSITRLVDWKKMNHVNHFPVPAS